MMLLRFRSNLEEVERVDNLTKEQREKNMRNIRSKDTQIELIFRKALWHRGYRYRKNYGQLPGKPDIAITKYRIAIFCDSEFFHGKNWYQVQLPRIRRGNNPEYWEKKISRNIERDNEVNQALTNIGWTVIRFWGKAVIVRQLLFSLRRPARNAMLRCARLNMIQSGSMSSNFLKDTKRKNTMTDNESGLTLMNVQEVVSILSRAYIKLIKNNTPLRSFPSVMLWGPPGIGKSQGVREIADNIKAKTGKKVHITDVRLLLFNPVDLRGIPTANADKTLAVWLRPQIFQMDAGDDTINILLLDEISAAPQSAQAAAYQITLDRTIGEHKLPENCIVIAAGNRVTDKSVAYNMPRAFANRLLHIEVKGDADSWHDWAVSAGIHPYVISYLEYNPTALPLYSFLIKNRVSLCPSFHQALSPSTGCKVNRGTYFFGVSMFANPA